MDGLRLRGVPLVDRCLRVFHRREATQAGDEPPCPVRGGVGRGFCQWGMTEGSDQCEDADLLEPSGRVAMSKALPGQCCCDSIIFNQVAQSLQPPCFASGSHVFRRCDPDLRMARGRGSAQACHEPLCLVRGGFGRCFRQRGRQHSHADPPVAAATWTLAVSANRLVRCFEAAGLGLPRWWKWAHPAALLANALKAEGATEGTCEKKDIVDKPDHIDTVFLVCLLYTSPSPRD